MLNHMILFRAWTLRTATAYSSDALLHTGAPA